MGLNAGEVLNGASTVVPLVQGGASTTWPFTCVKAINGNLVISAVTCKINYAALLPITLIQGDILYTPGATSVTSTSGQGVAFYE